MPALRVAAVPLLAASRNLQRGVHGRQYNFRELPDEEKRRGTLATRSTRDISVESARKNYVVIGIEDQ